MATEKKVALVTGANRGIGFETARQLGQKGVTVVVGARTLKSAEETASKLKADGVEAFPVKLDVTNAQDREAAAKTIGDKFGKLDILVNNAGVGSYGDFLQYGADDYDLLMNTNMRSTFLFTRHAVPVMKQQARGLILQISSQAGLRGFNHEAIYCATKHAQVGFTSALRIELQPFGIKVGVICPAGVKTEFALGSGRTRESVEESGFLEAEDVAEAVLFAATQSPNARMTQVSLIALQEGL
jgi:3-oxoacyl-[acyl-carrier protein] reductase